MKALSTILALIALLSVAWGADQYLDSSYVQLQAWQVQERQTLEWRVNQTKTAIARAPTPQERGRLGAVLNRLLRELCAKYPASWECK